jgi:Carbohydrate/starch-binding module (family 21)
LNGTVIVENLAYEKHVGIRYTLDEWQTTNDIQAKYSNSLGQDGRKFNLDRFNFSIDLSAISEAAHTSVFFCARYVVQGREYWDNNGGKNYAVGICARASVLGNLAVPASKHHPSPLLNQRETPSLPPISAFYAKYDISAALQRSLKKTSLAISTLRSGHSSSELSVSNSIVRSSLIESIHVIYTLG